MDFIFVTGASGFMGRRLSSELLARGHRVRALVRNGAESRVAAGCEVVIGDPLRSESYARHVGGAHTLVHLVGVAHPSPSKAAEFRAVDLASARASIEAARGAGVKHFVYVSVAHPAPIMRDYIAARVEGEAAIRESGMNATILRPWYVLGPGRRWPLVLAPVYLLMEAVPSKRESARRLGLVTLEQMMRTMVAAIEQPASGVRVLEVPQIRASRV